MKRSGFFKLLMGSSAAATLPVVLEAEEEFVPEETTDKDGAPWWMARNGKVLAMESFNGPKVLFEWAEDGSLWLTHSNGSKRKLI